MDRLDHQAENTLSRENDTVEGLSLIPVAYRKLKETKAT